MIKRMCEQENERRNLKLQLTISISNGLSSDPRIEVGNILRAKEYILWRAVHISFDGVTSPAFKSTPQVQAGLVISSCLPTILIQVFTLCHLQIDLILT
jgi:hypothetical protein